MCARARPHQKPLRGGVSAPSPPPPIAEIPPAQADHNRFQPVPGGPFVSVRACRTLPADVRRVWRAGGRRGAAAAAAGAAALRSGCGCSRYVRVVLRLLGLRLERAGGRHRPGRRRPGPYRALRHAPALRSLLRRPLPPRRRALLFTLRGPHGDRNAQALPPPLPPRVTQSMLGLVVPVMAENPPFLLLGFRPLKLQVQGASALAVPDIVTAQGFIGVVVRSNPSMDCLRENVSRVAVLPAVNRLITPPLIIFISRC